MTLENKTNPENSGKLPNKSEFDKKKQEQIHKFGGELKQLIEADTKSDQTAAPDYLSDIQSPIKSPKFLNVPKNTLSVNPLGSIDTTKVTHLGNFKKATQYEKNYLGDKPMQDIGALAVGLVQSGLSLAQLFAHGILDTAKLIFHPLNEIRRTSKYLNSPEETDIQKMA